MLQLKATKSSLHKLAKEHTPMPIMKQTLFWKGASGSYNLEWFRNDGASGKAYFAPVAGLAMLVIEYRMDGKQIARDVYKPTLPELRERGMIVEK